MVNSVFTLKKPLKWNKVMLLGIAGSGKTTQAKLLEDYFGYKRLSSGDLIREKYAHDKETLEALKNGNLAPKEQEIRDAMLSAMYVNDKFVLDGFPRTLEQCAFVADRYKFYEKILRIRLVVSPEIAVYRMHMRNRDEFDTDEINKKRTEEGFKELIKITNNFGYCMVDGEADAHKVMESIVEILQTRI